MKMKRSLLPILCVVLLSGCISEYIPTGLDSVRGILVVDGAITDGESVFALRRSVAMTDTLTGAETVDNATVFVETNDGERIPAEFRGSGIYAAQTGVLDVAKEYRLRMTVDGEDYVSGFLSPLITPPIDSISFNKERLGDPVIVSVSTHDPDDISPYYRWTYRETWEVQAQLYANARWGPDGSIIWHSLSSSENTYYCWGRDSSKMIFLATADKMRENVISQQTLVEIPCSHDKLSILYHIEVTQMHIRTEAYEYFSDMQQSVERTGDLFSPVLTTAIRGNIRCENDPERQIIGYIEVATATQMDRYFWEKDNLGIYEKVWETCEEYSATNETSAILTYPSLRAPLRCVDCRTKENAGKNKPQDWPTDHL